MSHFKILKYTDPKSCLLFGWVCLLRWGKTRAESSVLRKMFGSTLQ